MKSTTEITVLKCDGCKKEVNAEGTPEIPKDWIELKTNQSKQIGTFRGIPVFKENLSIRETIHLCSEECWTKYVKRELTKAGKEAKEKRGKELEALRD